MFEEADTGGVSRAAQQLNVGDPTDPQAEVLVRGDISPAMVTELVFQHVDDLSCYRLHAAGRRLRVQAMGGYFTSRRFMRTAGKAF